MKHNEYPWEVAEACDLSLMVGACRRLITDSPHVVIDPTHLSELVTVVLSANPVSWDWKTRSPHGPVDDRLLDLVFSSALSGGFFHLDPLRGEIVQWQLDGSGSDALAAWIAVIRQHGLLPWADWKAPADPRLLSCVRDSLDGIPYADERMLVLQEFASHWGEVAARLARVLPAGSGGILHGRLGLKDARALATSMPISFGSDPFAKKACLAMMLVASHLTAHGHDVDCNVPAPADYQLPRILHWSGVLRLSPEFENTLLAGSLINPCLEEVHHIRAATVVACHDLGLLAGRPDWMVDVALFGVVRLNPRFRAESLPPMRIDGTWF